MAEKSQQCSGEESAIDFLSENSAADEQISILDTSEVAEPIAPDGVQPNKWAERCAMSWGWLQTFEVWWNKDDLNDAARLLRHKGMRLSSFVSTLVRSPWWSTLAPATRGEILYLIISTCDPEAPYVPFGVIAGLTPERRAELRERWGGLFSPEPSDATEEERHDFTEMTGLNLDDVLFLTSEPPQFLIPANATAPTEQAN